MSNQIAINVISGLIVAILAYWFGFGGSTGVTINRGEPSKKTGKWIITISVIMFFIGLSMLEKGDSTKWSYDINNSSTIYGISVITLSFFSFIIGKFVAWMQK